jgi:hypothetical protein
MLWAVSLSTTKLLPRRLTATLPPRRIRSLADLSNPQQAHQPTSALPHPGTTRRCTSMHFGENQLSRSLIGLSPLPTTHPPGFQPRWVRASTRSYPRFTLAMGRSPRFGSTPRDSTPSSDSLSLRLPHTGLTSPRSTTRRLILQKAHHHTPPTQHALMACRHTVSGTLSLPSRGTFHHSLTVLIHYRSPGSI